MGLDQSVMTMSTVVDRAAQRLRQGEPFLLQCLHRSMADLYCSSAMKQIRFVRTATGCPFPALVLSLFQRLVALDSVAVTLCGLTNDAADQGPWPAGNGRPGGEPVDAAGVASDSLSRDHRPPEIDPVMTNP
jgi:hypothetical protein